MLKWVSVRKKLPDQYHNVLVWEKGAKTPFVGFLNKFDYWEASLEHYDGDSAISSDLITHWMDLPSQPTVKAEPLPRLHDQPEASRKSANIAMEASVLMEEMAQELAYYTDDVKTAAVWKKYKAWKVSNDH